MLGMAVAAFNQITGSRSVAMTQNQVAAFLSLARSQAMNLPAGSTQQDCGVMFYRDPQTGRSAMTLVYRLGSSAADPDPIDRYKAWTSGISYVIGDRVVALTLDNQGVWTTGGAWQPRILTKTYVCIAATAAIRPPLAGPNVVGGGVAAGPTYNGQPNPDGALFYNSNWEEVISGNVTTVPGFDPQLLPSGVAVQIINDANSVVASRNAYPYRDRYLRTGVVFFDRLGRLDFQTWTISSSTAAGQLLGLGTATNTCTVVPQGTTTINSGLGLVLYEDSKFSGDPTRTDADALFTVLVPPGGNATTNLANPTDEQNEELWLDQNATTLLINRASGSLIKGE
jgi:hypothetical protein